MSDSAPSEPLFPPLQRQFRQPVTGMSEHIADGDTMFVGRQKHYRSVGQSAWRCIALALLQAGIDEPRRILDLPCGHGRVMRILRRAFPRAALTGCDIERDGVDFCAQEFGATPVYSQPELANVTFDEPFDLIWCGSLVTHLDTPGWLSTFQLIARSLQPNGIAIITMHGRWVAYLMEQGHNYGLQRDRVDAVLASYRSTGFGYADYESDGYGISLSSPAWVLQELMPWQQLRIVSYSERSWDDHQDVLVVQRVM